MKLLFDQNLSSRLVPQLADIFPHSIHIKDIGLSESSDADVWEYAKQHAYIIVTKDSDFNDIAVYQGHTPFIIWIRLGNCRVEAIESCLRHCYASISKTISTQSSGIIELT